MDLEPLTRATALCALQALTPLVHLPVLSVQLVPTPQALGQTDATHAMLAHIPCCQEQQQLAPPYAGQAPIPSQVLPPVLTVQLAVTPLALQQHLVTLVLLARMPLAWLQKYVYSVHLAPSALCWVPLQPICARTVVLDITTQTQQRQHALCAQGMDNTNLALVVPDAHCVLRELILTTQYLLFTAAMALIVLLFSLVHIEAMWPHQL